VDFDDEINVLECFQKIFNKDMWQLFAVKNKYIGQTIFCRNF